MLPDAIVVDGNVGCLSLARTLVKRGVRVHVLARSEFDYLTRSRHVHGRILPPLPGAAEQWLAVLLDLARGGERLVFSGSDAATELLIRNRDSLPSSLRSFEGASDAHLALMDKGTLYEIARTAGVRIPWTRRVTTPDTIAEAVAEVDYPCLIKPALSHLAGRLGNTRPVPINNASDLRERLTAAVALGVEMLVSEYVPGGEQNLEGAITIRAADGSFPLAYGRRKVRQYPLDYGVGTMHASARVPEAIAMARKLLDAAGFVGVSILEAKRHAVTGELVLIEINVRVPGGFGLGDACGVDASWRLYATLAGLPLEPQARQREGVKTVLPFLDFLAARARLRQGDISWRELLLSYRGVRDVGVADPRDPGPAILWAPRVARRLLDFTLEKRAPAPYKRAPAPGARGGGPGDAVA